MRAHDRTRALAIDVQIADVELTLGILDLVRRQRISRTRESELGVVGDFDTVLEVARLDDGEHRAEDLFLRNGRFGTYIRDDGRLHEVAVAGLFRAIAAGDK